MADAPANPKSTTTTSTTSVNLNKTTTYIIVGLFSLLVTVIVAGTFLVITFRNAPTTRVVEKPVEVEHPNGGEEIGPLVPLGNEIVVNLSSEDGVDHYLRINATLEVDNEKAKAEVSKRVPQIRDLMISILRSKSKDKIDEKEGKEAIRTEIINSINLFLVAGKVKNLFFEDFIIQ